MPRTIDTVAVAALAIGSLVGPRTHANASSPDVSDDTAATAAEAPAERDDTSAATQVAETDTPADRGAKDGELPPGAETRPSALPLAAPRSDAPRADAPPRA